MIKGEMAIFNEQMETTMKAACIIVIALLAVPYHAVTQEIDCDVTVNTQQLSAEARENLVDFEQQIEQYINAFRWTKEDVGIIKIKLTIDIQFQASRDNRYFAQAFLGSLRPIHKSERNTAVIRIIDDKWEFDYVRSQPLSHNEFRFDPLLSLLDFYVYLILGYDFDTYGSMDGTPYFQKAFDIVNKARGSSAAGKGWETEGQGIYQRGQLVDELLNAKYRDLREATYKYHYKGLDNLSRDAVRARQLMLSSLEKIGKLREKINQRSLSIKLFFETKYLEIAESFLGDPDRTIYQRLNRIDPAHQKAYEDYSQKRR